MVDRIVLIGHIHGDIKRSIYKCYPNVISVDNLYEFEPLDGDIVITDKMVDGTMDLLCASEENILIDTLHEYTEPLSDRTPNRPDGWYRKFDKPSKRK